MFKLGSSRKKTTRLRRGYSTETGRLCEHNQDDLAWIEPEDELSLRLRGRLYIVADGMGGHAGGEIASRMAVTRLAQVYSAGRELDIGIALRQAIQAANSDIYSNSRSGEQAGMGTTIISAVIHGDQLFIGYVGDSRAYLLRQGKLDCLTQDQTLVNELVRQGKMTPEEAVESPRRHILSQAVGITKEIDPVISTPKSLARGDVLLLCSDGIHGYLDEDTIAYLLKINRDDPQAAATSLSLI